MALGTSSWRGIQRALKNNRSVRVCSDLYIREVGGITNFFVVNSTGKYWFFPAFIVNVYRVKPTSEDLEFR